MSDTKTKNVPTSALRSNVGPFVLGHNKCLNDEVASTAPFRMVARSGDPIDHWFFGPCVHDLSGMRLAREKVAIDYVHDENQIIGFANHFDVSNGDLEVSGTLTKFKSSDRATEIIHKARAGVPYEASINFGGDGIVIEQFDDDETVEVNGRSITGPLTVFRSWPLRGIAVCPYGADSNTSTEFSSDSPTLEVTIMSKKDKSATAEQLAGYNETIEDANKQTDLDEAGAVDSNSDDEKVVEGSPPVETPTVTESQPEPQPEPQPDLVSAATTEKQLAKQSPADRTGREYLDRFGDIGGVWFAEGRNWDESLELHEKALLEEIKQLKSRNATREQDGETEPVQFNSADQSEQTKRGGLAGRIRIAGRNYTN